MEKLLKPGVVGGKKEGGSSASHFKLYLEC